MIGPNPKAPSLADTIERLRLLMAEADVLPLAYRPNEYDDWGTIRGGRAIEPDHLEFVAAVGDSRFDAATKDAHRKAGTDPYEASARLIVEGLNALPALLAAAERPSSPLLGEGLINEGAVRASLQAAAEKAGSVAELARQMGVHDELLGAFLRSRRPLCGKVMAAVGLERLTFYRRAPRLMGQEPTVRIEVAVEKLFAGGASPPSSIREIELRKALDDLQQAEAEYRLMHDRHGDGAAAAGRAWDLMRRAGDKARALLDSTALASKPLPPTDDVHLAIGRALKPIFRRIVALERDSHPPVDFQSVVEERLQALSAQSPPPADGGEA